MQKHIQLFKLKSNLKKSNIYKHYKTDNNIEILSLYSLHLQLYLSCILQKKYIPVCHNFRFRETSTEIWLSYLRSLSCTIWKFLMEACVTLPLKFNTCDAVSSFHTGVLLRRSIKFSIFLFWCLISRLLLSCWEAGYSDSVILTNNT